MKGSRFTEEQIIGILREQEAGAKTADVCRKHGISDATFDKWKAKYGGLEVSEARRLKALEDERAFEPQIMAIYRRFGLNDRQIEILARATPRRDYYYQSRRGNRLFELRLGEAALAFTAASSKTDQNAISQIIAEHGRADFAAEWLRHKRVGWAADLLAKLTPEESR